MADARRYARRRSQIALDSKGANAFAEAQIQEGLEEVFRDRTSIMIAHRLPTVQHADRIVVLEQGAILEEGTHDELLAAGEHYATLYNTCFRHQSLEYKPWEGETGIRVPVMATGIGQQGSRSAHRPGEQSARFARRSESRGQRTQRPD